ncbi:MAG: flagellar hook-basal body complex protein FliE [Armatimonadota bacterium]
MEIQPIAQQPFNSASPNSAPKTDQPTTFAEMITRAIDSVSAAQSRADEAARKVAHGDLESLHEALLAIQEATRGMQILVQVRNKVIEAYQEIMRTQI